MGHAERKTLSRHGDNQRRSVMELETKEMPPSGNAGLKRLFVNLLKAFGGLVVVFIVIYTFGQRSTGVDIPSQTDQAIASAEASVRANANDVGARIALADAYLRGGRSDDALDQLNEILKAEPTNRSALLGVGSILYQQGDLDGAKEKLLTFVKGAGSGEFASADAQLERAQYVLGVIANKQEDYASAAAHLKAALKVDTSDADAWYLLGTVFNKLEQYKDAANSFVRALQFVPAGWCEPVEGLKVAYDGLKNADGSAYAGAMTKVCKGGGLSDAEPLKALVESEFAVSSLLGLAQAAENDHEFTQAIGWYKKVTAIDSTNVAAVNAIARLSNTPSPSPAA